MTKYDANGVEIKYTASEEKVPEFYKLVKIEGTTVTNEFELPKDTVNYKVNKVWDDNEIQAQRRPETIYFVLTKIVKDKDGNNRQQVVYTKTLTTSKENYVEFKELPKYDDKANVIDYNVNEGDTTSANGENFYESTKSDEKADKDGNIEVTITNKFTLENIPNNNKTDITVTKVWDDENNKAKKRTDKVILDVIGKDRAEEVKQENIELTAKNADPKNSNVWSTKVSLQKYDQDGKLIVYSAEEQGTPKFYTKSENGTTVTNKFVGDETTTKDIKITKKWEDNNNKAKKRPQSVKFIISSDVLDFKYEETLSEGKSTSNEWTKTIKVRKYDDNANEIEYTLDEEEVSKGELYFYKADVDKENFTITNTFKVPDDKVTVKVNKLWDDEGHEGKRPDKIKFVLTSKVGNEEAEYVDEEVRDVNTEDNFEFDNLPKYNEDGDVISYDVNEVEVNDNELFFYESEKTENTENNFQFTNTFRVPTGDKNEQDLTLTKVWDDNGNNAEKRPTSIVLTLNGTDNTTRNYTLTAPNAQNNTAGEWTYTAEKLPIYDSNGTEIEYNLTEENVPTNYVLAEDNDGNLTVTNTFTHNDEQVSLTLVKEWDDNENANRPEKVTFKITGTSTTGTTTRTEEVTEDTWTKEIKVDKYNANNDEITYTVTEVDVAEGYVSSTPSKEDNNTWKVTNSLPSISVSKEITKVTHSDGTSDTIEPNEDVVVTKGDVIEYTITVANNSNIPLNNVVVTDISLPVTYNTDGKTDVIPEDKDGRKVIELESALIKGTSNKVKVYYLVTNNDFLNNTNIANTVKATGEYTINDKTETVESEDSENASVEQVPGISITKTQKVKDNAPDTPEGYVGEGDVITYTITVKNTGNTVLKDINIVDEMSGQSEELKIEKSDLNIDTLEPTKTKVITATYTVTKGDISETENHNIVNFVTVTAKDSESDEEVEDEDETTPVVTEKGAPDISISKKSKVIKADKNKKTNSDGTPYTGNKNVAEPGDTIRYTITVKNNGNVTGTAKVADEAPKGTTFSKVVTPGITADTNGFSTEVEVGPKGTSSDTKTIEFEVTVTAKAGETIKNTAKLDGTPSGETTEDKVEKTVKVKTNTISNCNVVLVLDTSGSMKKESRLENVQTAAKNLINMLNLPAQEENGPQISVVRYSSAYYEDVVVGKEWVDGYWNGWLWVPGHYEDITERQGYDDHASIVGSATTSQEAETLKDSIDDLVAVGGTKMSEGLKLANQEIKRMDDPNDPNDKNIIIFLSDGSIYPSSSSLETESNVNTAVYDLKHNGVANQTIYTVPFGSEADDELLAGIASDPEYCLDSADGLSSLQSVFNKIINDLSEPQAEISENGRVYLENIDIEETDQIKITVGGTTRDDLQQFIKYDDTKQEYYLDLTEFNSDDLSKDIQIDYLTK